MLRFLLVWILLWNYATLAATPQTGDYLLYKGDTLYLQTALPLEATPAMEILVKRLSKTGVNTACWRGYYSIWELRNDSLFWRGANACDNFNKNKWILTETSFAHWITTEAIQPYGEVLRYEHSGWGYYYEYERAFRFESGLLASTEIYDNSGFHIPVYYENSDSLHHWLIQHTNWSIIDTFDQEVLNHTIVATMKVDEEGKATVVQLYRPCLEVLDREVIRLVELLPGPVFYRRGKLEERQWNVPINFAKLMRFREKLKGG